MTPSKNRPTANGRLQVALVSMPWAIFNRPSIQLGALKAFLNKKAPWLEIETLHPFLEVAAALGSKTYHLISLDAWAGEALYGGLLFPERRKMTDALIRQRLRLPLRRQGLLPAEPRKIQGLLQKQLQGWLDSRDWSRYRLVGFSVCFNQLLASLAAADLLKKKYPELEIALGGSSCSAELGVSLLNLPQVDYIINGEGELPLLELCEFLAGRRQTMPAAVISRNPQINRPTTGPCHCQQLVDLKELPAPDYHDYFMEMAACFAGEPFIPTLPLEFSRGCWWCKCTFCNLNIQWQGFRSKTAVQVQNEVLGLAARHSVLDFSFTDNALPPKEAERFFKDLAGRNLDLKFFGEIRVTDSREKLAAYHRGGLSAVQVGIESLSNSLLKKMNKGLTVLANIEAMKTALEHGILLEGNLITEFPGSTAAEVEETLENLDFVLPFHPLSTAAFFLGHGSPMDLEPQRYGIKAVRPHHYNRKIFPQELLAKLVLVVKGFRGDRTRQKKLWQPVVRKMAAWQALHQGRPANVLARPLLSYRDGGGFLIIRQEHPGRDTLRHRLKGPSRAIYLFCARSRKRPEIEKKFSTITKENLAVFLTDLVNKRLMFTDNDRYLALAVAERRK